VRKILGSSTFAVAETLSSIIERLKALKRPAVEDFADIDTAEEIAEEWPSDDEAIGENGEEPPIDPEKLKAEIVELESYLALARSISANAKGEKLISVLNSVLDHIEGKGGKRKAVIFTESVRTQKYLAELLAANGCAGEIVLMNGQNNDAESQAIYANWKKRHEGTDAISGSKTADMKAAIVESFRERKAILIATEAGAEGINLQFCSLVVNFDLPWNPQRVEQRIGRCHRYGQRIDVLVVNFLNLKNRAEERVFELLDSKFKLFDGVFGASDEVLGAIESGTNFEKRVFEIHQSARNRDEIDAEFDRLQAELDESIQADVLDARGKLIGFFDQDVIRILQDRKNKIECIMNAFDERLITIARSEQTPNSPSTMAALYSRITGRHGPQVGRSPMSRTGSSFDSRMTILHVNSSTGPRAGPSLSPSSPSTTTPTPALAGSSMWNSISAGRDGSAYRVWPSRPRNVPLSISCWRWWRTTARRSKTLPLTVCSASPPKLRQKSG
jgi:Helicase conserved C-terminal domain